MLVRLPEVVIEPRGAEHNVEDGLENREGFGRASRLKRRKTTPLEAMREVRGVVMEVDLEIWIMGVAILQLAVRHSHQWAGRERTRAVGDYAKQFVGNMTANPRMGCVRRFQLRIAGVSSGKKGDLGKPAYNRTRTTEVSHSQ